MPTEAFLALIFLVVLGGLGLAYAFLIAIVAVHGTYVGKKQIAKKIANLLKKRSKEDATSRPE